MPILQDNEFGKVVVRRSKLSKQVRLRVAPDGSLRASLPYYAPMFLIKRLLSTNRSEIRKLIENSTPKVEYQHGMIIGKSHQLSVTPKVSGETQVVKRGLTIEVYLHENDSLGDAHVINKLRPEIIKALRLEAKSYLPKRLDYIAQKHGFNYSNIRFSHSGGRWGSCNSNGTISLNIALMKLPFELIDYVIIHELSHTIEMNHSQDFWDLVKKYNPEYKMNRKILKNHSPSI